MMLRKESYDVVGEAVNWIVSEETKANYKHNFDKIEAFLDKNKSMTTKDYQEIVNLSIFVGENNIPFPQADDFNKIIQLCELLHKETLKNGKKAQISKQGIANHFEFHVRQGDLYGCAAAYLGLVRVVVDKSPFVFELSELGEYIMGLNKKARNANIVRLALKKKVLHDAVMRSVNNRSIVKPEQIVEMMKNADLRGVESDVTYLRRAQTIASWTKWVFATLLS